MAKNRLRTIIDALSQGDEKDFKKIFAALAGPLYYYIYNKFIQNHEDTEEIITDVFLKVIPELGNFNDPKHVKDWLFKTARYTCLNHIAKQNTQKQTQFVDIKEGMENLADPGQHLDILEADAQWQYRLDSTLEELHRLSPQQQTAIRLHYLEEMTINEVAIYMKIKPGTVKKYIKSGRLAIKELVLLKESLLLLIILLTLFPPC
jgi:RNA polymerase sigma-70 factor (ECF subfamily)